MPLVGIEARAAPQAAVHHHAHAVDGERGLGDRGGEDDLAPALRIAADRLVLLRQGQVAIERQHDVFVRQPLLGAADLRRAGQEGKDVAALLGERAADCGRHAILQPRSGIVAQMMGLDRKGAALRCASAGAPGIRCATLSPSSVADITTTRRSSRRPACASSAKASAMSPSMVRSWNSSNRIAADARQGRIALQLAQEEAGRSRLRSASSAPPCGRAARDSRRSRRPLRPASPPCAPPRRAPPAAAAPAR